MLIKVHMWLFGIIMLFICVFFYFYFFTWELPKVLSSHMQPIAEHVEISGTVSAFECKDPAATIEQFVNLTPVLGVRSNNCCYGRGDALKLRFGSSSLAALSELVCCL